MNRKKNQLFPKVLLGIFLIMVCFDAFSFIYDNGAGSGYGGEEDGKSGYSGNTIENYIIEGAGYFLAGYSDVLRLLNRIELSGSIGTDFAELNTILESALVNVKNSRNTYTNLIHAAENTPYNESVIAKLIRFDYKSFQKSNELNSDVFQSVGAYLGNGNITGIFRQNCSDMKYLEGVLLSLKEKISLYEMPTVNILWELNQEYASALLFGQYVAQVFQAIK